MNFLSKLKTNNLNQNGYNRNTKTLEKIGMIFISPIAYTPNDCLPCDGFVLNKNDYINLFNVIGNIFNIGTETENEFRIPDFNISGRFLQPGGNVGTKLQAGLPNITANWGENLGYQVPYYSTGAVWTNNVNCGRPTAAVNLDYDGGIFYLDASRSNAIYGKSSTVQPPSQIIRTCIKYK